MSNVDGDENKKDGKTKAIFGVPSEMAQNMIQYPVLCRGGCFILEIETNDEYLNDDTNGANNESTTTFISATFDSIDAETTAEAISTRLAVRLAEPIGSVIDAGSMLGMSSSSS